MSAPTEPAPGFLEGVVERAHAAGALVVFDEIITGFRLAPGGAQERYGVSADLAAFGKALGNGMPISALAGRAELMDRLEDVFFSGTHGGETLSLAAARAVLDTLDAPAYERPLREGRAAAGGRRSGDRGARASADWVTIGGAAPRTVVDDPRAGRDRPRPAREDARPAGAPRARRALQRLELHLPRPLDEDIDHAVEAYGRAFERLADGLAGRPGRAARGRAPASPRSARSA